MSLKIILGAALLSSAAPDAAMPPLPVIDGHADFAIHYLKRGWSVDAHDVEKSLPGQADVPRWRKGGINGMLVTVGSDLPPSSPEHFPRVNASLDWLDRLVARHNGSLAIASTAAELEGAAAQGKIALMPAIEGGDQIDQSLANLRRAHARGVRSIGIVYDHHNAIGDGAMVMPDSARLAHYPSGGLSNFGRELIAEMNRLGIIVDLSHAAEKTALDAIAESIAPVIFSHSAARALADTPRNLSDGTLRAVAARGGVVMVPLVPYLTTTEHWRWWTAGEARYASLSEQYGRDEDAIGRGMAEWDSDNPQPKVTIRNVADQVEHIARVAGKDYVGIGSDFDGMGSFAIDGLKDAAALPALFEELGARGWTREDLEKLASGNFLRVLRQVESTAAASGTATAH